MEKIYPLPTGYKIRSVSTIPKSKKAYVFGYSSKTGRSYMFVFDRAVSNEHPTNIIEISV